MSVYLIAQGTINDREMLNQYMEKVVPTIPSDAKVLSIDENAEVVEGEVGVRTVLIEFPDRAAFRAWYDSPEYQAIVHLRLDSVAGHLAVAEGLPG
ncbi:MAG TPA: DUF1330 domain-containing protein [Dehalococcoidia bacterium]|nr:DUF1330 domain-containing protein [Dehalococcoidia bacterium]